MNGQTIEELIDSVADIPDSQDHYRLDITGHINYAWENSDISKIAREEAIRIFKETNQLIIIGYSFPTFNKNVDRELFSKLNPDCKIYYQDPNATLDRIQYLIPKSVNRNNVVLMREEINTFHLPYDFDQ